MLFSSKYYYVGTVGRKLKMKITKLKGFKRIHINDVNELQGSINAAHYRLSKIEVSESRTLHAVEKDEVLNLLSKAQQIIEEI